MSIIKQPAGTIDSKAADLYTLDNGCGLSVQIYNLGGIIKSIKIHDRDVVLGRNNLQEYKKNDGYLGAAIGRCSNRIKNAQFNLDGKEYQIGMNDGSNSLHGGHIGFNQKVWSAKMIESAEPALELCLESPDNDEGFPGNIHVRMTYVLTLQNSLKIIYEAVSDRDTVFNPTNHSYFNLDGHNSGKIYTQTLQINAEFFTPNTEECIPNGEILRTCGTPFDFTKSKEIGKDIFSEDMQLSIFGGYDHNFVLMGRGFKKAATLTSTDKSLSMEVYTDMPGMQVYTANCLEDGAYKDGAKYGKHSAICFETQFFPNSPNVSHFHPAIIKSGEKFKSVTEYKFISK